MTWCPLIAAASVPMAPGTSMVNQPVPAGCALAPNVMTASAAEMARIAYRNARGGTRVGCMSAVSGGGARNLYTPETRRQYRRRVQLYRLTNLNSRHAEVHREAVPRSTHHSDVILRGPPITGTSG